MTRESADHDLLFAKVFRQVKGCIDSDFALPEQLYGDRITILYCGAQVDIGGLQSQLGLETTYRDCRDVLGLYVPELAAAVVSEDPEEAATERILAHELCHAICHMQLGSDLRVPWVAEAYAEYVTDRVLPDDLASCVAAYSRWYVTQPRARLRPALERVLRQDTWDPKVVVQTEFGAMSNLFFRFLVHLSDRGFPRLWVALRNAVRGVVSPIGLLEEIERITDKPLEEIEILFAAHWERQAAT